LKIVVVGGGIIGLCSAFYATKEGHEVTILDDRAEGAQSCSTGNAGMIVPSHFVPLAAPGMIGMGLKMMLNPKSPFGFNFPPSLAQIGWTTKFLRSATKSHVAKTEKILRDLNWFSLKEYEAIMPELGIGNELQQHGLLMLCKSQETLDHEYCDSLRANELGMKVELLDQKTLKQSDSGFDYDVAGAVLFNYDAHLTPHSVLNALHRWLRSKGVKIVPNCLASQINGKQIQTSRGSFEADQFVIASGIWSTELAKNIGLKLPMMAGKGYSFTIANPIQTPLHCSLLVDARVAVTPMQNGLRIAGTMEIGPPTNTINQARIQGIKESILRFFPKFSMQDMDELPSWHGHRPCSPDGLPYIGRAVNQPNVIIASGHSMMGLSLGPITGKIVNELISNRPTSLPTNQLDPNRYA
jgi:D-amino-acid dehydrogenase